MSNENLRKAKQVRNDEFYTQYEDIEKELTHYKEYLKGKIVYCNCDQPTSNFVKFLNTVKAEWGIKDVWHTSIQEGISYDSPTALELLTKCDIVISNPPFGKARLEYIPLLMQSGKQFLFIGNLNMATYKEVFPLIRDGKMWTGYTYPKQFLQPDGTYKKFGNCLWWTNLPVEKDFALNPDNHFDETRHLLYDNYAGWNVDKVADIPCDKVIETTVPIERIAGLKEFYGNDLTELGNGRIRVKHPVFGVPITFIQSYTPPPHLKIGGYFGSTFTDSAEGRTDATSQPTDDTAICDTLLGHRGNLTNGGGRTIPQIAHSLSSGMNTTSATERIWDSSKSMAKAFTRGLSSTTFDLIGVTEENGVGLSGGGQNL